MELLYLIGVKGYGLCILVASVVNNKARQWVNGRKHWKSDVQGKLKAGERRILFHCSSLGEFEQGKPVLEALRKDYPELKVVLTFFSPSGYEIRKKEPLADYVFYLPLDGPANSREFLEMIRPELAFFVKYDFWHFYIKELRKLKVPIYFVSSIFRPSQVFFKPYGFFFLKMLRRVSHLFVQNQQSLELLYQYSLPQVTVTGDTRFDRVYKNRIEAKSFPAIEQFAGDKQIIVAGSTWGQDELILAAVFKTLKNRFRLIVAPHEIDEATIRATEKRFADFAVTRYSHSRSESSQFDVMIIDNVGMLSSLYRYADIAFIGGGFGRGIHNILEAAVFGVPVYFGPNYKKFREARELIHWKGAFVVRSGGELLEHIQKLIEKPELYNKIREINLRYIDNNKGATELIIEHLRMHGFR